jgi:hypothetical protein
MSDLAASLPLHPPLNGGASGLPAHLYGTRAALFYLLREADAPIAFVPARPAPAAPAPRPSAQIVHMPADPVRPQRTVVRDMLMSDSFDFRDLD